ncbi:hemerythrin domain-containing protein [Roseateles sp. SL47]|uniref:hemerythrin domain-containing protein n=1 Tax=Roseateles sp. SL47 TaxID=2995138 RepID=UPI002270F2E7|nr:hemerythrin domain-containing protein [Roseateles sp. SL47]WAC71015.1 hemerythrin domain-containing protein [Roseateles sp. SL47]
MSTSPAKGAAKTAASKTSKTATITKSSTAAAERKASASASDTGKPIDAIQWLTDDHKEVQALFKDYQKLVDHDGDDDLRQQLAQEICAQLTIHATIEEEIFYPAARDAMEEQEGEDLLDEAEVEHASAKQLIAQIAEGSASDALYDAKVKVLGEYIAHHVKEEEKELFPQVRKTDLDLDALGTELSERKEALLAELEEEAAS